MLEQPLVTHGDSKEAQSASGSRHTEAKLVTFQCSRSIVIWRGETSSVWQFMIL